MDREPARRSELHGPATEQGCGWPPSRGGESPILRNARPVAALMPGPRQSRALLCERRLQPLLQLRRGVLPLRVRRQRCVLLLRPRGGSVAWLSRRQFPSVTARRPRPSSRQLRRLQQRPRLRPERAEPVGGPVRRRDDVVARGTHDARPKSRDTSLRGGLPTSRVRLRLPESPLLQSHRFCPSHAFPCLSSCVPAQLGCILSGASANTAPVVMQ
jgi:hypothetical protein